VLQYFSVDHSSPIQPPVAPAVGLDNQQHTSVVQELQQQHQQQQQDEEGDYVYDIYCVQSPLAADDPRVASRNRNGSAEEGGAGTTNGHYERTIVMDPLQMSAQATQLFDSVGLDQ
jgi:hypothetical protein